MKKHILLLTILYFFTIILFIFFMIKNIEILLKIKTLIRKIRKKSLELRKLRKLTQQQVFSLLQTFDFIIVIL